MGCVDGDPPGVPWRQGREGAHPESLGHVCTIGHHAECGISAANERIKCSAREDRGWRKPRGSPQQPTALLRAGLCGVPCSESVLLQVVRRRLRFIHGIVVPPGSVCPYDAKTTDLYNDDDDHDHFHHICAERVRLDIWTQRGVHIDNYLYDPNPAFFRLSASTSSV